MQSNCTTKAAYESETLEIFYFLSWLPRGAKWQGSIPTQQQFNEILKHFVSINESVGAGTE